MKDGLMALAMLALAALLIGLMVWWQVFRWHECRKVGHSRLYCIMQSNNSACQHTSCRMRCALLMFMLLYSADHEKCTPPCNRSEKVTAAADRQPRRAEISLHSD